MIGSGASLRRLAALAAAALAAVAAPTRATAQAREGRPPEVLVVPVEGEIGVPTVALVRRAIREARDYGVAWLVLDIDTPGGLVASMREVESMLGALRATGGVATVAYVRARALSAGGYLALACGQTFMAPHAVIGDIMPVELGPGGMQQIADDDARSKMYSAFRADVRSLAEARNLSPDALLVAEAMVDPRLRLFDVVYEDSNGADVARVVDATELEALEARGIKVRNPVSIGPSPMTLTDEQAARFGFSSGTYASLNDLLREGLGVAPDRAVRIAPSWSESAVDWLEAMKPFLFLFGFVLLLIEVKTPGFAVPGVLGLALLGLGLFSSYLVGLAEWTEIILFFLGLAAIGVELFLMPGTIVFGVAGFACVLAALILSQQSFLYPTNAAQVEILEQNLANLLWLLLLVACATTLAWRLLPKVPVVNRAILELPEGPRTGDAAGHTVAGGRNALVGRTGTAATDLRPAGVLELDGERLDVVADGGFVERGARIRIVDVSGNRIVVVPDAGRESGATSIAWLVLLLVIGLCLVIAEVFFVSFGVLAAGAALALVSAVFLAFTQHGQAIGFLFLALCVLGAPTVFFFALRFLPHTRIGKSLLLAGPRPEEVSKAAQDPGLVGLHGRDGVASSDLRPAGFAQIDGRRVDVVTRGELIELGTRIVVVSVEGNRVVVAARAAHPPQ